MQSLRTPWADQLMVLLSGLGDTIVVGSLTVAILAWLAWRRCWFAAAHWLAAVGLGALLPLILQLIINVPRPEAIYSTLITLGFPSSAITVNVAMDGFLSVLIARELPGPQRWLPYAGTGLLIAAIELSHLYLGIGSLSDTVGGLTLGLAWTALLGIAYVRHATLNVPGKLPVAGTVGVVITVLLLSGAWHISGQYEENLQRYAPRYVVRMLDHNDWWAQQWQSLPSHRIDFEGQLEQPLTVQWAGSLPLLRTHLQAQGWHAPAALNVAGVLNWLTPVPVLTKLPILPQVHDGRQESLVLVHEGSSTDRYLVLRLWPSDVKLRAPEQGLWVGNITSAHMKHPLPLFTVPLGDNVFNGPQHDFQPFLKGFTWRTVRRPVGMPTDRWDGSVVLITSAAQPTEGSLLPERLPQKEPHRQEAP